MNPSIRQMLQTDQQRQCDQRLENDTAALEAAASDRMQVRVQRFGRRVREICLLFPDIRTAFFHRLSGSVEIHTSLAEARIHPNSGNFFPYPLGAPAVLIYFPNLNPKLVPWSGGLCWLDQQKATETDRTGNPDLVQTLFAVARARSGRQSVGLPCLWREGEWTLNCDLRFVARQVHRLLTDPRDYSPVDSMNSEAALYWAAHKDQLPLEPPITEIYGKGENRVNQEKERQYQGFNLIELEQ
jgi:hypothetical protein